MIRAAAVAAAKMVTGGLRVLPDPDERGRVYEVTRAHAEAEAAERPEQVPEPGRSCDGTGQRSYWTEVPRFGRSADGPGGTKAD